MHSPAEMSRATKYRLDSLLKEVTNECRNGQEEFVYLATMIHEAVDVPFEARVARKPIMVVAFETPNEGMVLKAVCQEDDRVFAVDLSGIEWMAPVPEGFDWIEAYLEWQRRL